jgi:uncharacterized Zn-finger protein
MWDPQRLTTLWAFTVSYRDSFTFYSHQKFTALRPRYSLKRTLLSHFLSRKYMVLEQSKVISECQRRLRLYIYMLFIILARAKPRGTPTTVSLGVENSPSTKTSHFLSVRKEAITLIRLVENSDYDDLYSSPQCHVVSKAFSMSKNTAAIDILLLKFRVTWSASLIHWNIILWSAWKPTWLAFSIKYSFFDVFLNRS